MSVPLQPAQPQYRLAPILGLSCAPIHDYRRILHTDPSGQGRPFGRWEYKISRTTRLKIRY